MLKPSFVRIVHKINQNCFAGNIQLWLDQSLVVEGRNQREGEGEGDVLQPQYWRASEIEGEGEGRVQAGQWLGRDDDPSEIFIKIVFFLKIDNMTKNATI